MGRGCSGWGWYYIVNYYITAYNSLHPVSTAPPFAERTIAHNVLESNDIRLDIDLRLDIDDDRHRFSTFVISSTHHVLESLRRHERLDARRCPP